MKYLWVLFLLAGCTLDFEQERVKQSAESKRACFANGGVEYQITANAVQGTCVYRNPNEVPNR